MDDVEIISPSFRLKEKTGRGGFSPLALQRAERAIMALTGVYIEKAISDITALRRLADDLSEQDENRQGAVLRQIAQAAREIKGQGGTFDFSLLSRIARSLYEFTSTLTHVDIRRSGIVMAHVDAMELIIMDRIVPVD